jgi:hypothetical protein
MGARTSLPTLDEVRTLIGPGFNLLPPVNHS